MFVYVDQNFLINASKALPAEQRRTLSLARAAGISFVLSPWSMVEVAGARPESWEGLAWFAESLNPLWLPERRRLQQQEVEDCFFRSVGIPYSRPAPLRSLIEVMAELARTSILIGQSYSVVEFVRAIRSDMAPITEAFLKNTESRQTIETAARNKQLTTSIKQEIHKQYLRQLLPAFTPSGLPISRQAHEDFLADFNLVQFPSVAVEVALSEDALQFRIRLSKQAFLDRQHIVTALPYVDVIATDDRKLVRSVGRIAAKFPFPKAKFMSLKTFAAHLERPSAPNAQKDAS